jgi:hypothetical protein
VDVRAVELVSASRLADLLREISSALASGQDPLATLAGIGYRADERLTARLTRLALLNLSEQARRRLRDDPLFVRLLGSALLGEALFAASGAEEQFFVNTGAVAVVDQVVRGQVPTIAGLLVTGRQLSGWLVGRLAQLPAGVLGQPDRTGRGPAGPARTIGELVYSRLDEVTGEFDAIEAAALAVLGADDREAAGQRLRALTVRWSRAMHKLGGVVPLGGDSGSPRVPVLTRRLDRAGRPVSRALTVPLQAVDRPGRRAAEVGLDDYLAPVNNLLSWPVRTPTQPLAAGLGSASNAVRFWELVRADGGIVVGAGPVSGRRVVYLRAMRRGGHRVFAVGDPARPGYRVVRLPDIADWARSDAAWVHDAYLPGDPGAVNAAGAAGVAH